MTIGAAALFVMPLAPVLRPIAKAAINGSVDVATAGTEVNPFALALDMRKFIRAALDQELKGALVAGNVRILRPDKNGVVRIVRRDHGLTALKATVVETPEVPTIEGEQYSEKEVEDFFNRVVGPVTPGWNALEWMLT